MATKTKTKKPVRKASKTAVLAKKKLTATQLLEREIAKRNKAFQKATAAEKRVLIAKDVIAQIKARRLKARSRAWIIPQSLANESEKAITAVYGKDESVQKLFLSKKMEPCNCCALGGLFMSCTLYNNKTNVAELDDASFDLGWMIEGGDPDNKPSNGLADVFSHSQLRLIELAFEGGNGYFSEYEAAAFATKSEIRAIQKAVAYRDKYPHDEKCLVAIMKNIIQNNGTFKP